MDIREHLDRLHAEGNYREIPTVSPLTITDYSTNDYMGLAAQPELQAKFFADPISSTVPMTSSAARLLAPRQIEYTNLEVFLNLLYRKRRGADTQTLLFNSGYHANSGLIPAIAAKDTLIVADKLVHASIIDGIVLSRAPFIRFRHNDIDHLEKILKEKAAGHKHVLVIVESVYSMDGDKADIEKLIDLKCKHRDAMLYVDEAHGVGIEGPSGLGSVMSSPKNEHVDIIVGTLGKAYASMGAYAMMNDTLRQFAINKARSFIFSTALPPINIAWSNFIFEKALEMDNERSHLKKLARMLCNGLAKMNIRTPESHIQGIPAGNPFRAVEMSQKLKSLGFDVLPIRTPTVPPGTDRLRVSLSASLTENDINLFLKALSTTL